MTYNISDISILLEARKRILPAPAALIAHLCTDSRRISFPDESLFFALSGRRCDGHDFLADAFRAGIRNFIVSRPIGEAAFPEANFVEVPDVLTALQKLAALHRRRFTLSVIGITGSNGKTIVKEWLFQLLQPDRFVVRSPRSYNSQLGVPLSVWGIQPEHELAIFEAGISRKGEMERLAPIIRCDIGIFTNIGDAHSDGFQDLREKVREKLRLFQFSQVVIYCSDYEDIEAEIGATGFERFSWSCTTGADLQVLEQKIAAPQTFLRASYQGQELALHIPFTDQASIENAIHCWATLLYLGYPHELIARRMLQLEPVGMRMELKEGINHCVVINDSYNSDVNALHIALQFLSQQLGYQRRTLILSDILQSRSLSEKLYARVAELIVANGITRFFGIGDQVKLLAKKLPPAVEVHFYPHTESFLADFANLEFNWEVILLKGARPFAFERIAQLLAQKTHRTVLEVDLNALQHNLAFFRGKLRPDTRLVGMVKAAAYGSGSLEVARLLTYHSVDYLAVAYADEGVELRRGGIQLPIMVLNPEPDAFDRMNRFRLEPELYSSGILGAWLAFVQGLEGPPCIHLKIDTGMHRLGFGPDELPAALALLLKNPESRVQTVFTHLAGSEAPEHDDFTHQQVAAFDRACEQIVEALGYQPWRHVLNTTGILRFPQYQYEMVRLGIGLYGVDASGLWQEKLQSVLQLRASISQIKWLSKGASVGYGRRGKIERPTRLATISIGYADGLPRSAGNGHYALWIRGKAAPTVGSVCMDMCMVDITQIPEAQEGDPVVVFGDRPRVESLAHCDGTIPYEILTRVSARVKRIYIRE